MSCQRNIRSIFRVDGPTGPSPIIGPNGNWWINNVDTGVSALGSTGPTGPSSGGTGSGPTGPTGESITGPTGPTGPGVAEAAAYLYVTGNGEGVDLMDDVQPLTNWSGGTSAGGLDFDIGTSTFTVATEGYYKVDIQVPVVASAILDNSTPTAPVIAVGPSGEAPMATSFVPKLSYVTDIENINLFSTVSLSALLFLTPGTTYQVTYRALSNMFGATIPVGTSTLGQWLIVHRVA